MTDLNAKIIPLHSEVEGRVPTDTQLDVGELAYNITDRKIYTKDTAGNIVVMGAGADSDSSGLPGGDYFPTYPEVYEYEVSASGGCEVLGPSVCTVNSFSTLGDTPIDVGTGQQITGFGEITKDWTSFEYSTNGVEGPWTSTGTVSVTHDQYGCNGTTFGYNIGAAIGAATKVWVRQEGGGQPLPPVDGDILRYESDYWRTTQFTLENLNNVYKAPSTNAPIWDLIPEPGGQLPDGKVYIDDTYVMLSPIDKTGQDRTDSIRLWFESIVGESMDDGDDQTLDDEITLTFYRGSIEYTGLCDRIEDDTVETGVNDPSFRLRVQTLRDDLGQTDAESGTLGIRELDAFLGYSGGVAVPVGAVLQYDGLLWRPQPLDFSIEDSNDFALRVDQGSGNPIAKTTGDTLVWDGSNWVPANVAAFLSISDLTDVNTVTTAPTDGQVLAWDQTQGYWKPADAGSGGGGDLQGTTESGNTTDQGIFITKADTSAAIDLTNTGAATFRGLVSTDPATRGEKIRLHTTGSNTVNLGVSGSSSEDILEYNIEDGNGYHKFTVGSSELLLIKALGIEAKQKMVSPVTVAEDPGNTLTTKRFVEELIEVATGGGLSGAGALTERADITVTNSYDAGQSRDEVFIGLGEAGTFVQVTVSRPAWVRFYATAQDRTSDAGRTFETDPLPGSGVLLEVKTTQNDQVVKITPAAVYYNNDTLPDQALYAKIRNDGDETASIAVTVRAYTQTSTDTIDGGSFGSG